jgi:hypothetical protein
MRSVLFWLAIGMLGAAVPAAATGLVRVSNCTSTERTLTAYTQTCPITGSGYRVMPCRTVTVTCQKLPCKIGIPPQTCETATDWSSHQTFGKSGIVPTSELNSNPPNPAWGDHCDCALADMVWW